MATAQKNKIQGLDELIKKINKLGDPKQQKKAFVKGLRAGGKVILKVAKGKVPRGDWSGADKKQIFKGTFRSQPLWKSLFVKVKSKKEFHMAFVGARIKDKKFEAHHHAMVEGDRDWETSL